jgi:DNA-binding NtrC family response regulator
LAIEAFEFFLDGGGPTAVLDTPAPVQLRIESAGDFTAGLNRCRPAAYVVRNDEIGALAAFSDAVVDLGTQRESKELAALLLGRRRVALVRGKYRQPGRLTAGVRELLRRAAERGESNAYIIGAADHVFDRVRDGHGAQAAKTSQRRTFAAGGSPLGARQMLDRLPYREETDDLRRRYVGSAACVQLVRRQILLAGESKEPVLILGPTGTGKENVARAIHYCGKRRNRPFVPLNTAAISSTLFESELFGYVKGAFTGASMDKPGLWESAGDGTLFLDEIGDLDLDLQKKILRVLDNGESRRVGSTKTIEVAARVVAATNRDLFAKVESGRFREDLYFRLRGGLIRTPPVREHPEDIAELSNHLWERITEKAGVRLPAAVIARLESYRWPGNVREMHAVLAQLYATFKRLAPRADDLELVFALQGQRPAMADGAGEVRDATLHRAECLGQLRRAGEVIRACEVTLRPLADGKRRARDQTEAIHRALHYRLVELDLLCQHPVLFHGADVFDAVNALRDQLEHLHHQLERHPGEARRYYVREVKAELKAVLKAIFKEVALVVDGSSHGS